tara:strand:- start:57 stop:263 length:207 start_codon:yes stop_codon:yes gene_type:complete
MVRTFRKDGSYKAKRTYPAAAAAAARAAAARAQSAANAARKAAFRASLPSKPVPYKRKFRKARFAWQV